MAASVVSCGSATSSTSDPTSSNGIAPFTTRIERTLNSDVRPLVDFLLEHFVPSEPILASLDLDFEDDTEIKILLEDLVHDCIGCGATMMARDLNTRDILGVCLASRHQLFEKQMDRLCRYSFKDERLSVAIEFLKYVFNRVDVGYHLEESRVTKPVFIALIAVKPSCQKLGVGKQLLRASLDGARDMDRCDAAFTVCSSEPGRKLLAHNFKNVLSRIRYRDYRGEYRDPPITPRASDGVHLLLARL